MPRLTASPAAASLRPLQPMAWLCAVLVLAIIILSAYIRLSDTGTGCSPWPQCQDLPAADATGMGQGHAGSPVPAAADLKAARTAHRLIASTTLLLVLAMVAISWRPGYAAGPYRTRVAGLLGIVLFLAILGVLAGSSQLPAVILGNQIGGFLLLACSVHLATSLSSAQPGTRPVPDRWLLPAAALLLVQLAIGGMVSAGHAGLSCPAFGSCDLGSGSLQAFRIWEMPASNLSPTHAGGAWVHLLHRVYGLGLMLVLLFLAWRGWRRQNRLWAVALAALAVSQVLLGLGLILLKLPLPGVLAHNLFAALMLALLMQAHARTQPLRMGQANSH